MAFGKKNDSNEVNTKKMTFRELESLAKSLKTDLLKRDILSYLDMAVPVLEGVESFDYIREYCESYSAYVRSTADGGIYQNIIEKVWKPGYDVGLVIPQYVAVLDSLGEGEIEIRIEDIKAHFGATKGISSKPVDMDALIFIQTVSLIASEYRKDHFMNGSFINESVASGRILYLYRKLRKCLNGSMVED